MTIDAFYASVWYRAAFAAGVLDRRGSGTNSHRTWRPCCSTSHRPPSSAHCSSSRSRLRCSISSRRVSALASARGRSWEPEATDLVQRISFLTLAFAQLWYVLNTADRTSGLLINEVSRNRWVWAAIVLCTGLLLAGVYLPTLSDALGVVDPGRAGWTLILAMSLVPLAAGRIMHLLRRASLP